VVVGVNRSDAILRMRRALEEYKVLGLKTTLPFLDRVLHHPSFEAGDFDTGFVEKVFAESDRQRARPWEVAVAAAAIRAFRDRVQARRDGESAPPSSGWQRREWRHPEGHF
jgi:acetyl-CoA carboxylase biotin carboxylase subunit